MNERLAKIHAAEHPEQDEIPMITRREFVKEIAGVAVSGALVDIGNKQNLVAACGLYCGACPNYLASQQNDDHKFRATVEQLSSRNWKFRREDLLCDGCRGGRLRASFCQKCAIRACAAKKTETGRCSECSEFACSRIAGFINDGMLHHAEVLENLRQIRKVGIENWAKQEDERWHCPQCRASIAWYDPACIKCGAKRSDRLFALKKA